MLLAVIKCTISCANAKVAVKTMIMIKDCFNDLQNFMRRTFELFNVKVLFLNNS